MHGFSLSSLNKPKSINFLFLFILVISILYIAITIKTHWYFVHFPLALEARELAQIFTVTAFKNNINPFELPAYLTHSNSYSVVWPWFANQMVGQISETTDQLIKNVRMMSLVVEVTGLLVCLLLFYQTFQKKFYPLHATALSAVFVSILLQIYTESSTLGAWSTGPGLTFSILGFSVVFYSRSVQSLTISLFLFSISFYFKMYFVAGIILPCVLLLYTDKWRGFLIIISILFLNIGLFLLLKHSYPLLWDSLVGPHLFPYRVYSEDVMISTLVTLPKKYPEHIVLAFVSVVLSIVMLRNTFQVNPINKKIILFWTGSYLLLTGFVSLYMAGNAGNFLTYHIHLIFPFTILFFMLLVFLTEPNSIAVSILLVFCVVVGVQRTILTRDYRVMGQMERAASIKKEIYAIQKRGEPVLVDFSLNAYTLVSQDYERNFDNGNTNFFGAQGNVHAKTIGNIPKAIKFLFYDDQKSVALAREEILVRHRNKLAQKYYKKIICNYCSTLERKYINQDYHLVKEVKVANPYPETYAYKTYDLRTR